MYRLKAVEIKGIKYQQGSVVVLKVEQDIPQFGKLVEVILTPSKQYLFVILQLATLQYQHHYHAYEVCTTDEIAVCKCQDMYDYHPLELTVAYGSSRHNMVSLKYHVF